MSETNTNEQPAVATSGEATEAQATEASPAKLYPTRAEADATKNHKPYEVSKNGTVVGWIWARGYDNALALTARAEGFTVSLGGKTAPVTKETIASRLSEFSDDELAAMGLSRRKTKGK